MGMTRFKGGRIWLKKLLSFWSLRICFTDWWILKGQWITDFVSAWIMDFVCFEVWIVDVSTQHTATHLVN